MEFPKEELEKMCWGESTDLKAVGHTEWVKNGDVENQQVIFQYEDKFYSLVAKRCRVNDTQMVFWVGDFGHNGFIECPEFEFIEEAEDNIQEILKNIIE
jgi:hypothetical protein